MSRLINLLRNSRKESYGFDFKTLRLVIFKYSAHSNYLRFF